MKQASNHKKYLGFRHDFPTFVYQSYSFQLNSEGLHAEFIFELLGKCQFKPQLKVKARSFYQFEKLSKEQLENFVFHIGMVELISYWKTTCSPNVVIKPHSLTEYQLNWWKKLYFHGLGEFFYLNGIEAEEDSFMQIASEGSPTVPCNRSLSKSNVLVPVGGGKDSIVTLELLKESEFEVTPFVLNPREASERTITIAGFTMNDSAVLQRSIDPSLIELNKQGFLNGHTPFSALLAFCSALTAVLSGAKYIALSNENSANESTVPGSKVNHQYSKSFEFEQDFVRYVNKYLHADLKYFSFLRPLNELQIACLFSNFKKHFPGFRSCNVGSKTDSWCGSCPKCLFTYSILSPFIPKDDIKTIFGKDLLDDSTLRPIFDELTGKAAVKPFECVGTPEEVNVALSKTIQDYSLSSLPYLLTLIKADVDSHSFKMLLSAYELENYLTEEFDKILKRALAKNQINSFKAYLENNLKGHNKVLLLGFGREGQSSYRLLRSYFPDQLIGIADKSYNINNLQSLDADPFLSLHLGDEYLEAVDQYDFVLKSPGIPSREIKNENQEKISSQTDLFLRYFREQTIGVTGTKGKSTTSSLIAHLLNKNGVKAVLLGNIGVPAFDLIDKVDKDTVVVFELSAHQLEYLHSSPKVAILLNVFPEHLDHFEDFEKYRNAKLNIFKYQKLGDIAITETGEYKSVSPAELFTFSQEVVGDQSVDAQDVIIDIHDKRITFDHNQIALKGKHNKKNITAALLAVSVFGVDAEKGMSAVTSFKPLPHRLEFVGQFNNIQFYNDSISTVPESTIAALQTLENIETLILGGFDRGLDYSKLVTFLKDTSVQNIILLGKAGSEIQKLFVKAGVVNKSLFPVASLADAMKIVKEYTKHNGICLLSPAAASYDQFHNFEHRGNVFKELIGGLFGVNSKKDLIQ